MRLNVLVVTTSEEEARAQLSFFRKKFYQFENNVPIIFKPFFVFEILVTAPATNGESIWCYLVDGVNFSCTRFMGEFPDTEKVDAPEGYVLMSNLGKNEAEIQVKDEIMKKYYQKYRIYPQMKIASARVIFRPFYRFSSVFWGKKKTDLQPADILCDMTISRKTI